MFDYLMSGNIILSSKINAYEHILKDKYNSFLIEHNNVSAWKNKILFIFKNIYKFSHIKYNAIMTGKKYSWEKRAEKFMSFAKKKFN